MAVPFSNFINTTGSASSIGTLNTSELMPQGKNTGVTELSISNPNPGVESTPTTIHPQISTVTLDYILRTGLHLDSTKTGVYNLDLEPGLNGYFLMFLEVTPELSSYLLQNTTNTTNLVQEDSWLLLGATTQISIPSVEVASVDYKGYNDVKLSTPIGLSYDNEMTVTLADTWNGAIYQYITAWVNYINPQFPLGGSGDNLLTNNPRNIKGNCLIVQYDHSFSIITSAVLFYGVYPSRLDIPTYTLEVDLRTFEVPFKFDRMFFGPQLLAEVMRSATFGIGGTIPQLIANSMYPSSSISQTLPENTQTSSIGTDISDISDMISQNINAPINTSLYNQVMSSVPQTFGQLYTQNNLVSLAQENTTTPWLQNNPIPSLLQNVSSLTPKVINPIPFANIFSSNL